MGEHLNFGAGLTAGHGDDAIKATYLGQAHIAGTGPAGKTCRECVFWHGWRYDTKERKSVPAPVGHYGPKHKLAGQLKKARCHKPILNKAKRQFTGAAQACRLFEQSANPPAELAPRKHS